MKIFLCTAGRMRVYEIADDCDFIWVMADSQPPPDPNARKPLMYVEPHPDVWGFTKPLKPDDLSSRVQRMGELTQDGPKPRKRR